MGVAPPISTGRITPGGCSSLALQSTSQKQLSAIEVAAGLSGLVEARAGSQQLGAAATVDQLAQTSSTGQAEQLNHPQAGQRRHWGLRCGSRRHRLQRAREGAVALSHRGDAARAGRVAAGDGVQEGQQPLSQGQATDQQPLYRRGGRQALGVALPVARAARSTSQGAINRVPR